MKQLLLVAVIHLLILHQYGKDKNEVLAPKKNTEKISDNYKYQDYWFRGISLYTNDSLRISYLPELHPLVTTPNLYGR